MCSTCNYIVIYENEIAKTVESHTSLWLTFIVAKSVLLYYLLTCYISISILRNVDNIVSISYRNRESDIEASLPYNSKKLLKRYGRRWSLYTARGLSAGHVVSAVAKVDGLVTVLLCREWRTVNSTISRWREKSNEVPSTCSNSHRNRSRIFIHCSNLAPTVFSFFARVVR